jgi:hypothetical protein
MQHHVVCTYCNRIGDNKLPEALWYQKGKGTVMQNTKRKKKHERQCLRISKTKREEWYIYHGTIGKNVPPDLDQSMRSLPPG